MTSASASIADRFRARAQRNAQAPAIRMADRVFTYAEVQAKADVIAAELRARAICRQQAVAVMLSRQWTFVPAMLGIFAAGGVHVPIDPDYPAARREFLCADSGAALALVPGGRDPEIVEVVYGGSPAWAACEDETAYVMYTSGSTGDPKGVRVSHRNLTHTLTALQARFGFVASDVFASLAPFAFDISLFELCTPWLTGASTRIFTREEMLDLPRLVRGLAGVTVLHAVPSLMRELVEELVRQRATLPLRLVFVGGERVPPDLVNRMRAIFPAAALHILYGPTEATIICTSHAVTGELPASSHPIGTPLDGVSTLVLDDQGCRAADGTAGELYVGGPGVALGYAGSQALTQARFLDIEDRRWYRTGDRVRRDHRGTLEFLGRTDGQVKIRGHRVEIAEVERAACSHPSVQQAVVRVREDETGSTRLIAYVVPHVSANGIASRDLRAHLAGLLPAFMLPHDIVTLPRLPLSPNGKVDYAVLPVPHRSRDQEADSPRLSPVEQIVAAIWRELLQCGPIDTDNDFFALGGDSLSATRVTRWLADIFDLDLSVQLLLERPALRDFAAAVAVACGSDRVTHALARLEQYR